MSIRPQGRPKNRWEDDVRNDTKKLKIAASRIAVSGNYMLRRAKHSKIEGVAPEEEEDKIRTCYDTVSVIFVFSTPELVNDNFVHVVEK